MTKDQFMSLLGEAKIPVELLSTVGIAHSLLDSYEFVRGEESMSKLSTKHYASIYERRVLNPRLELVSKESIKASLEVLREVDVAVCMTSIELDKGWAITVLMSEGGDMYACFISK